MIASSPTTLEAALWAFHRSDGFREGALLAVNLGDDADTTGAIYGQIAGAHYGAEAIPAAWRDKLAMGAEMTSRADHLHAQAATGCSASFRQCLKAEPGDSRGQASSFPNPVSPRTCDKATS